MHLSFALTSAAIQYMVQDVWWNKGKHVQKQGKTNKNKAQVLQKFTVSGEKKAKQTIINSRAIDLYTI